MESRRHYLPFKSYFHFRFCWPPSCISVVCHRRLTSINVGQHQAVSSVSSQSRAWSIMWRKPLESRRNQLLLKSYFHFRFGGRHLESVVHDVRRHRRLHSQVGHGRKCGGSHWNYVCMLVQTEVASTRRKSSISPARVPLVFQLAPGTGKRYVHAENAQTSGIGPARNRF